MRILLACLTNRLLKIYAANVLTTASIQAAGENLKDLKFDHQLVNEIGSDTWVHVAELEEEHDPKPFFQAVRNSIFNQSRR